MAIPIDHTMPMAESSRILPFVEAHSMPNADAAANINAPHSGFVPAYSAIPKPPNEACVTPPHKNTRRRDTMYVPTKPLVMPAKIAANRALAK
jgi:hypothetical protein